MAPLPPSRPETPTGSFSQRSQTARAGPCPLSIKKERQAKAMEERGTHPNSSETDPPPAEGPAPTSGTSRGDLPIVTSDQDASHVKVVPVPPSLRPKTAAKRKRGRPPIHGEYVGLRAARAAAKEADRFEMELAADDSIAETAKQRRITRQECVLSLEGEDSSDDEEAGGKAAKSLVDQLRAEATLVEEVALKSKDSRAPPTRRSRKLRSLRAGLPKTWAG